MPRYYYFTAAVKILPLPSVERLNQLFLYDKETGNFVRKVSVGGKAKKGTVAGKLHHKGYIYIQVDGVRFGAHRLAYRVVTGIDPGNLQIDHVNNIRSDNSFNNLRLATNGQNKRNGRLHKNNTTGIKGVDLKGDLFRVRIQLDGNSTYLGSFSSLELAKTTIVSKREIFHKEFANHGL
jgi:hypothetical protein